MDNFAPGNKVIFHYFLYKLPEPKYVFLLFSLCQCYSVIFHKANNTYFPYDK